jgi:hypothetical protein
VRARLTLALVLVGTAALLTLIVVLVTGGFVIDAGPLHFSSRRPLPPLVIAFGAWLAAALYGPAHVRAAAESLLPLIERHATVIAAIVAVAAAGIGTAYGTYSAAGADAAGYVSQSALIASGRIVRDEPLARQVGWPDATWTFSPLGYRPGLNPGEIVPTYPSGLPLAMTAGRLVAGDAGVFLTVPLLGALAVLCTYGLGVRLHSRLAGLAAAALLATSPIFLFQIVQPMSDVPAAAWWTLATLLALSPVPHAAVAAGATAGLAVLTRPNLILLAVPLALLTGRRALACAAGIAPAIAAMLALQWRLYGSPLVSGYGPLQEFFALSNVPANARGHLERLLTGETAAVVLAAASLVLLLVGRGLPHPHNAAAPAVAIKPAALVAALIALAVVASYLPYGSFTEWSYLRFLLPAFPAAFVVTGALLAGAASALPSMTRGLALGVALVTACAVNITTARREQAFNLQRYESRYREAGEYLAAVLPVHAVVLTSQHSASVHYYTGLPIVRWDLLTATDPDVAVNQLRALGRRPVFLVEDWEVPVLRARFPQAATARLDWTPSAEFGTETRVRFYDPADRGGP